jgi:parallel beta-helix repeat protein
LELSEALAALQSPGALGERLRAAVCLGQGGVEAALEDLRALAVDPEQDVILRGYCAWAAEQVAPRPSEDPGQVFHVANEHPRASDGNPGTEDLPWATVQRAAEALRPGDTVIVHRGLYRELVRPFLGGAGPDRPITYQAAPGERVVLSASDPWQPEWRRESDTLYSAPYSRLPWDYPEEWPTPASGTVHRAEQVFVDGQLVTHVGSLDQVRVRPNTFYTDDQSGRLWLHLMDGDSPEGHSVERSQRQQVFAPAVRGLGYLCLRGLTFRRGAAPAAGPANASLIGHRAVVSVRSGHHWVIEDNLIEYGNAQGLDLGQEGSSADLMEQPIVSTERGGHEVRRNRVHYHGVAGIVGWGDGQVKLVLDANETSCNCAKSDFYFYESAGVKLNAAKDCVIRRHRSHANLGVGVWLGPGSERNRVTQCILSDNVAAGLYYEESKGPLLADNNVILHTRDTLRGGWAEGIHSQGGNRATYISNYIAECEGFGVRIRNLFDRLVDGRPPSTSHNRVANSFLLDNGRGALSMNPDVPHARDNQSAGNLLWERGLPITIRLENGSAGVQWEKTDVGHVLGRKSGGDLMVPFAVWRDTLGQDAGSLLVPSPLLMHDGTPEAILEMLIGLWPDSAPGLACGYGDVAARPAGDLMGSLREDVAGLSLARTLWLTPTDGVQVWTGSGRAYWVNWYQEDVPEAEPIPEPRLLGDAKPSSLRPVVIAAGETRRLPVGPQARVVVGGLPADVVERELLVSTQGTTEPGEYGILVVESDGWRRIPVEVVPAAAVEEISSLRDGTGAAMVLAKLSNRRGVSMDSVLSVQVLEEKAVRYVTLPSRQTLVVRVPVALDGVAEVKVAAQVPGLSLSEKGLVSLVRAVQAQTFVAAPRYPIHGFPGGDFPEGLEDFQAYYGGLGAQWAARYDAEGLHLRVEVEDRQHNQSQPPAQMVVEDSVQVLLRAPSAPGALGINLCLDSSSKKAIAWRRVSPDPKRFTLGLAKDVGLKIHRKLRETDYELSLPWEQLGLSRMPRRGTPLRLSLVVNNNDGRGRHGLQWFFGIHTFVGEEDRMGTLWLD